MPTCSTQLNFIKNRNNCGSMQHVDKLCTGARRPREAKNLSTEKNSHDQKFLNLKFRKL